MCQSLWDEREYEIACVPSTELDLSRMSDMFVVGGERRRQLQHTHGRLSSAAVKSGFSPIIPRGDFGKCKVI